MKYLFSAVVLACVLTIALGFLADNRPVLYRSIESRAAAVACGLAAVILALAYGAALLMGYDTT